MLVEGHCRKAFGQSVGNHLLSRAWEELDHLGGDGLANPIPASVNVSRGFSIDRILSHANDSTRIFIEFGGSCLEYATFSIRRFNIIVICPRCLIQSYSSLGVAAPKHFRAWKATANRTDFAAKFIFSVTHLLPRLLVSRKSCPRARRQSLQTSMRLAPGVSSSNSWRPCSPRALLTLGSPLSTPRSPPRACSAPSHPRSRCVK